MARKPKLYTRLAGRASTGMVRSSLWLGPDHLLKVSGSGYREEYRRYYFKDIQAISIGSNSKSEMYTILLLLGLFLAVIVAAMIGEKGGIIFGLILGTPLLAALIVNLAKGPGCVCRITTAVQADKIEPLSRMRKARRVLERLRPIILEAQGGFTDEDRAAMAATPEDEPATGSADILSAPAPSLPPSASATSVEAEAEPAPPPEAGRMPAPPGALAAVTPPPLSSAPAAVARVARVTAAPQAAPVAASPFCSAAFTVMILYGILRLFDIVMRNVAIVIANTALFWIQMILLILALARTPRSPQLASLRRLLFFYLIWMSVMLVVAYFSTFYYAFAHQDSELLSDMWHQIQWLARQNVLESPVMLAISLVSLAVNWLTGLSGLLRLSRLGVRPQAASAPAAAPPEPTPAAARQES